MKLVLCCVLALFAVQCLALQELPERARGGLLYKQYLAQQQQAMEPLLAHNRQHNILRATDALTWQAPVTHFDPLNNDTFSQRYYVDATYYKGSETDAPVFFMIGGESSLNGPPGGYMAKLAQEYGALLVALEHRYYGESIPYGNSKTGNLVQFLTVENALADLNAFTQYYKELAHVKGKWFVFGGSYPGALASWYRMAYPDASVGSLSSSGVVNPIIDYTGFDKAISQAVGNQCAERLRDISQAFELASSKKVVFDEVAKNFKCEADITETDFLYMLADAWSMVVQYSQKSTLCNEILTDDYDIESQPLDQVLMRFTNWIHKYYGESFCSQGFYNTAALSDLDRADTNARSWRFQTCYQVAYFNTAPARGSIRAQQVNLDYHLQQCETIFGASFDARIKMNTMLLNEKFGADEPTAHNTFYTDFSDDPWQRASVDFPLGFDQPYFLATCDDCGHCMDFHMPSEDEPEAVQKLRAEFERYLKKWLNEE